MTSLTQPLNFLVLGMVAGARDFRPARDVLGNPALHFPPNDSNQMSEQIRKLLNGVDVYLRLSQAARVRATEFKWELRANPLIRAFAVQNSTKDKGNNGVARDG